MSFYNTILENIVVDSESVLFILLSRIDAQVHISQLRNLTRVFEILSYRHRIFQKPEKQYLNLTLAC